MQRYTIITLFPELVETFRQIGIVRRACDRGLVAIEAINPRDFAPDRRGTVDDAPYGGGPGMVMMVPPLRDAIRAARSRYDGVASHVAYLSPQGRRFEQDSIAGLAAHPHLVLVAGRYEGIDERVIARDIDSEWSIGDFVVSGGELPALTLIDAIVRTLPGALGDAGSAAADSFVDGLLDYPHYTRPEVCDGDRVPAVLLSGDHAAIARWRRRRQLARTRARRPDLLAAATLSESDRALLADIAAEEDGAGDGGEQA
ncbi:MAG: tRNA (guanosine(37)-N1)-methyltransferase TrmD [Gammaproteobacteria bacterium]